METWDLANVNLGRPQVCIWLLYFSSHAAVVSAIVRVK